MRTRRNGESGFRLVSISSLSTSSVDFEGPEFVEAEAPSPSAGRDASGRSEMRGLVAQRLQSQDDRIVLVPGLPDLECPATRQPRKAPARNDETRVNPRGVRRLSLRQQWHSPGAGEFVT